MKRYFIIILVSLVLVQFAKAQKKDTLTNTIDTSNNIYTSVDKEPEFNGKGPAYSRFLLNNIRYPSADRENNVQGKVFLKFVVEKDGTLSNFEIISSPDKTLADEAMRVIKLSPPWVAGLQNGKSVRVWYTIPISFALAN